MLSHLQQTPRDARSTEKGTLGFGNRKRNLDFSHFIKILFLEKSVYQLQIIFEVIKNTTVKAIVHPMFLSYVHTTDVVHPKMKNRSLSTHHCRWRRVIFGSSYLVSSIVFTFRLLTSILHITVQPYSQRWPS